MKFARELKRAYDFIAKEMLNNDNVLSDILLIPFNNKEFSIKNIKQLFDYLYTREYFTNNIFIYESEIYNLMRYIYVYTNNKNKNKFEKFSKIIFSDIDFFIKFYECIKKIKVSIEEFDYIYFNCLRSLALFFIDEDLDNLSEEDIYKVLQFYKNSLDEVETYIELSIYSSFPIFICTDENIVKKFINKNSSLCELGYGLGISNIIHYMLNRKALIEDFTKLYKSSIKELVSLEIIDNGSTLHRCEFLFRLLLYISLTSKIIGEMGVNINYKEIFNIIKDNRMVFLDNFTIKIGHKILFNKKVYELFIDCLININNNTNKFLEKIFIYDLNVYKKFCDVIFNDIFLYVTEIKNNNLNKLYNETNLFEEFVSLISKYKSIPSFVFITLFCLECGYIDLNDLDDRRSKISDLEFGSLKIWEVYYNNPSLICEIINNDTFNKVFFELFPDADKDNCRLSIYDYNVFSNILRKDFDLSIFRCIKASSNEFYYCIFRYFGVFVAFILVPYMINISDKSVNIVNVVFDNVEKYVIHSRIYVDGYDTRNMYKLVSRDLDLSLHLFLLRVRRRNKKMFLRALIFSDIVLCFKEKLFIDKDTALFVEKFIRRLKKNKKNYMFGVLGSVDEVKKNKVDSVIGLFFNLNSLV